MKRSWIKKQIKKIGIICIGICIMLAVSGRRAYAMELSQEEKVRGKECRLKYAEYEMNAVLDMLGIKEWNKAYAHFRNNESVDEPIGRYSKEALEKYMAESADIEVKVEYFLGASTTQEQKDFFIQIIKIYKSDNLIKLGRVLWDYAREGVIMLHYYESDKIGMEGIIWEKKGYRNEKQPLKIRNVIYERAMNLCYKGDAVLREENFKKVMETFMGIKNISELRKLAELPLTKEFYDQCIENFPYVERAEDEKQYFLQFYGIDDRGKIVCEYIYSPLHHVPEINYTYFIEMQIKDEQIDSMDMKLVLWEMPVS